MTSVPISRRRAIVVLALTSILLLTLDLRGNGLLDRGRDTFGVLFQPVRGAVRVVTRPVENAWAGITDYDRLAKENERLREEIDRQRGAAIAAEASVREAQELIALNGLPTLAGVERVTAQVVGVSPSNFSQTIEISQGSSRGIRVGMPVVNAAGLVGRVTRVFPDRAIVLLVTDPDYALAVKVLAAVNGTPTTTTTIAEDPDAPPTTVDRNDPFGPPVTILPSLPTVPPPSGPPASGPPASDAQTPETTLARPAPGSTLRETGVLTGRGPDRAPVVGLVEPNPRFGRIAVGAAVVTAGGEQSPAPPDIVVGTVSRVIDRPGSAGPLLEVRLLADPDDLNFVMVLLYRPATEAPR
jgi:rod shape-determining protein MreC